MNHCLKFPDQKTATNVLLTEDKQKYKNIDVIGVIYASTGNVIQNEDGTECNEMQALDGWHVNVWVLPDEDVTPLLAFVVTPANPVRTWG